MAQVKQAGSIAPGEALHAVTKSMTPQELARFKKELQNTWLAYLRVVAERAARDKTEAK